MSEGRVERDRILEGRLALDRDRRAPANGSARQLVQVYTAGTLPTCTPCVYLGHPADLDGNESEGAMGSPAVDTSRSIPFVLIRGSVSVGDMLPIHAAGGRWVGERTGSSGGGGVGCGSCTIPATNLTASWSNLIIGNGMTSLIYSGGTSTQWTSACTNQLIYSLVCTGGQVEFRVYYFVSGSCPTGQSQYCSTIRANPFRLQQTSLTCSPFLLTCNVTSLSCPNLASNGYSSFTVSQ